MSKNVSNSPTTALATRREAALFLRMSESTIKRMTYSGRLKAVRLGTSMVRYRWIDLHALANGEEVE